MPETHVDGARACDGQGDQEHAELLRQQAVLARFGELALWSDSLDEILQEACRLVTGALGTDLAKVLELQEDGRTLLVRAGLGWKPGVVGELRIEALEDSSEGHALQTGEPVISPDVGQESRFEIPDFLHDNGVRALVNVVIIGGRDHSPYGVLQVDSREPRRFSDNDISFLRGYANLLAAAVDRLRVAELMRQAKRRLEQLVTQRTQDLHDSQDFTRLALSSVGGVGVWTYDVASDRFFCSSAISELYGIDPDRGEAGIGRLEFLANVHPDDLSRLRAVMAGGLEQPGDFGMEYRIRHPDGSVRWVHSRGHTYADAHGRTFRRVGIGVETTRQRQLEEQLRQSQKMEAVGQLTGGLAHDFNNLLTGIAGSLELLQTRVRQGRLEALDRYIAAAQGAASRAAALTHRLLAFSRRQTLDPKPTDVGQLIAGLEELIRRTVGPAILLDIAAGAGLPPALVDPNQLENALLNLCINARDAMPDGGRLSIRVERRWVDERAAHALEVPAADYLVICVGDDGSGMAPDVVARAFDPFFTTKPIGEGTGLGLSMIYGFARQSGGQAHIDSEVGRGTTVCLYLPSRPGELAAAERPSAPVEAPRAGPGETVLVVDDEPTVRMLVAEVLGDQGYTALEAADGAAGLAVLRSDARIDLLVTDVGLPGGINGRQMAEAGQVLRPGLKVLFITGYAEAAVVDGGRLGPGMQIMTKPFAIEALGTRIRDMISGATPPKG